MIFEQKLAEWRENSNHYPDIMSKFSNYIEKKESDGYVRSEHAVFECEVSICG